MGHGGENLSENLDILQFWPTTKVHHLFSSPFC